MQPRFVGRLGLADAVTVANGGIGFLAAAAAAVSPSLSARLLLAAAVADALDGIVARARGSTEVGQYLDSLADVVSFSVAPALFVLGIVRTEWSITRSEPTAQLAVAALVATAFVAAGVVRLGLYTAYDSGDYVTEGVQTTLAATVLAAAYLAGIQRAAVLLAATAVLVYLMVAPVRYPELYPRDAFVLGLVQSLALLFPTVLGRAFPKALLVSALAYLVLAPRFYWREV